MMLNTFIVRYHCPVLGCEWFHDDHGPAGPGGVLYDAGPIHPNMLGDVMRAHYMQRDRVFGDHLLDVHGLDEEKALWLYGPDEFEIPVAPV
jgi:hypothetical protein